MKLITKEDLKEKKIKKMTALNSFKEKILKEIIEKLNSLAMEEVGATTSIIEKELNFKIKSKIKKEKEMINLEDLGSSLEQDLNNLETDLFELIQVKVIKEKDNRDSNIDPFQNFEIEIKTSIKALL